MKVLIGACLPTTKCTPPLWRDLVKILMIKL